MIVAQYYNIMRLGRKGYSRIVKKMMGNAEYLSDRLVESGKFRVLNSEQHIPVVTFRFNGPEKFTLFDLSYRIRERGWIVPAYSLPPEAEDTTIMRVVVRENFTRDLVDIFVDDLLNALDELKAGEKKVHSRSARTSHPVS